MSGHGGGTGELSVAVHAAQSVGHAVRGGTGSHVVRVQGTARTTTGSHGEVLLTSENALLLVSTGNGVLEAGGVGGVTGDGNVHALEPHDGHALAHVVSAVAVHLSALAVRESGAVHHLHLTGGVVELGLAVGEAVDTGDDVSGVLAKAVQDNAQRLLAHLVGGASNTDSTFSSSEGLVTCQEAEALSLLAQKHSGQIAVAQTHLTVVSHRAGNAESLQTFTDSLSGISGLGAALLNSDSSAYGVGPTGVLESDVLDAAHDLTHVDTLLKANLLGVLAGGDTVLSKDRENLVDAAGVGFKKRHNLVLCVKGSLLVAGVNVLGGVSKAAVGAGVLLHSLVGVHALLDVFHHRAHLHVLIAGDFTVGVQSELGDVTLSKLQIARALGQRAVQRTSLRAKALTKVLKAGTDGQTALGVSALGATVNDLQEEFAHSGVDGVAHQVGVQSLLNGLAGQNLTGHSGGVGHTGAADGLHQSLLNNAVLYVQRQLAGTLLGSAPTHTVGQAGNILGLRDCGPGTLLRDGGGAVIAALLDATHLFYFVCVLHSFVFVFGKTLFATAAVDAAALSVNPDCTAISTC